MSTYLIFYCEKNLIIYIHTQKRKKTKLGRRKEDSNVKIILPPFSQKKVLF